MSRLTPEGFDQFEAARVSYGGTVASLARAIGVSPWTVKRWRALGRAPVSAAEAAERVAAAVAAGDSPRPTRPLDGQRARTRNAAVIAEVRAGDTLQAVADRYGITRERVRQICARAGVRSRQSEAIAAGDTETARRAARVAERERLRTELRDEIIRRYLAGEPLADICAALRVRYHTANQITAPLGIRHQHSRGRRYTDEQLAEVEARLLRGENQDEIAWATGVGFPSVQKIAGRVRGRIYPSTIRRPSVETLRRYGLSDEDARRYGWEARP